MTTDEPTPVSSCLHVNYEGKETNAALSTQECSRLVAHSVKLDSVVRTGSLQFIACVNCTEIHWLACVIKLLKLIKQNRSIYVVFHMLVHTRKTLCLWYVWTRSVCIVCLLNINKFTQVWWHFHVWNLVVGLGRELLEKTHENTQKV
jgi:hypothetical protein